MNTTPAQRLLQRLEAVLGGPHVGDRVPNHIDNERRTWPKNTRRASRLCWMMRAMLPRPLAIMFRTSCRKGSAAKGRWERRRDACALSRITWRRLGASACISLVKAGVLIISAPKTSSAAASTVIPVMASLRRMYTSRKKMGWRLMRRGGAANRVHARRIIASVALAILTAPVPWSRSCPRVPERMSSSSDCRHSPSRRRGASCGRCT